MCWLAKKLYISQDGKKVMILVPIARSAGFCCGAAFALPDALDASPALGGVDPGFGSAMLEGWCGSLVEVCSRTFKKKSLGVGIERVCQDFSSTAVGKGTPPRPGRHCPKSPISTT
jgi:hypothetical protein